jgi:uroporphyrinogen decarboxylase
MSEWTTHERVSAMYEHREADRIPITDGPWKTTIERWHREGMPEDVSYVDYFDLDRFYQIHVDTSPRFKAETLEETDEYLVRTTVWGGTERVWKHAASTPEHLDFIVKDREAWAEARERMVPGRDRIDWERLDEDFRRARAQGAWISAGFWFGFDVTHSRMVGTERMLMAMVTDPDWVVDMYNHYLDMSIALFEMVWEEGYHFDCISWPDDMGYKLNQFFSVDTYRELLKPVHKRAVDWAHDRGVYAHLHSCGDIRPLIPELVDIGLDALNPLEVKAGMDPVAIKEQFGDDLVLHGGINAADWPKPEKVEEEIRRVVPELKKNGGYIFSSDHSVPDDVSLEAFRRIVELARELGSY